MNTTGFRTVALACVISLLLGATPAAAQIRVGTIAGTIRGIDLRDDLSVTLTESTTAAVLAKVHPDKTGRCVFRDVPFASYIVSLHDATSILASTRVLVSSPVTVTADLDATREYSIAEVTIEGTGAAGETTTHTFYAEGRIGNLPTTDGTKKIETILLNTPGVVPDEDGRMHIRGEDAQLQYVVDGIPITGNMTRVYASLFDADLIRSVDIQTGGLNAEYGVATAGILSVTTKSGFDAPFFVHATGRTGSFNTRDGSLQLGGNLNARAALYLGVSRGRTDRYLDPITSGDPMHDEGTAEQYFGKLNTILADGIGLVALGGYDKTTFAIPNGLQRTPSQDQQQKVEDYLFGARLSAETGESSTLSLLGYTRRAKAAITSGGLSMLTPALYQQAVRENEKFFFGGNRQYTTTGGQVEFSARHNWLGHPHIFRAGVGGESFPVKEFFTFAVTNPAISNPDSSGGDDRYLPYDITQGGSPFLVDQEKTGHRYSGYVQDEIRMDRWTINAGLRFDAFELIEKENAISPRVGVHYQLSGDLGLRASYNRIVMQAPLENYLVSSSAEARQLTGAEQMGVPTVVRSEKAHVLEIGGAYRISPFLDVDVAAYGKFLEDFIVKVELGNSGVIFPANLKEGIVAGGEVKLHLSDWNNFSGFLAVTTCVSRGLKPEDGSSPVSAGLILGEEGENYAHPFGGEDSFPTEHNQLLTAALNVVYNHPSGLFGVVGARFDSGLPFDLVGPNGEALDAEQSRAELKRRGYSDDVLDLLELEPEEAGSPDRSVAPHVVVDLAAGYDFGALGAPLRLSVNVSNVFDTAYLYKFESSFGGTHFGVPRIVSLQLDVRYP